MWHVLFKFIQSLKKQVQNKKMWNFISFYDYLHFSSSLLCSDLEVDPWWPDWDWWNLHQIFKPCVSYLLWINKLLIINMPNYLFEFVVFLFLKCNCINEYFAHFKTFYFAHYLENFNNIYIRYVTIYCSL